MELMNVGDAVALAQASAGAIEQGVQQASADGCLATFYERPIQNRVKSEQEGRPVFDGFDYVQILIPGDPRSVPDRPVKDEDKLRWPEAWARYQERKAGKEVPDGIIGTPVSEWPFVTATRVAELKAIGIHTVEQVANMPDARLGHLGPDGAKLKERAAQYLSTASEVERELRTQLEEKDAELADLKAQMGNALRRIEQLEKPSRGPRKGAKRQAPDPEDDEALADDLADAIDTGA